MDDKESVEITAFDHLYTTRHIQILKIMIPYLPESSRRGLAVYIKLAELFYAIQCFTNVSSTFPFLPETLSVPKLIQQILPYCTEYEKEKLQNIREILENLENMQEMMQFIVEMKELFPTNTEGEKESGTNDNQPNLGFDFSSLQAILDLMQ